MAKKFNERLDEWVKNRETSRARKDKNLVAFLALKDDIKAALDNGFSMKTIWEFMYENEQFKLRYETFLKYVNKHIKNQNQITHEVQIPAIDKKEKQLNKTKQKKPEPDSMSSQISTVESSITQSKQHDKSIGGFVYDATPNKEDLI